MPDEFDALNETIRTETPSTDFTSHLLKFRLENNAFAGTGQPSRLFVVFKAKQGKKKYYPECEYVYDSTDHTFLASVFERMSLAESPGEILHAELIGKGNRGTKVR